jgi:undecaprenyl-phosphate 4-deoxy-4-formamido-L-arabinose transferase
MADDGAGASREHTVSVVVPVYRGETTLESLLAELDPLTDLNKTPAGRPFRVEEVLLVHDGSPDRSDVVIRKLAADHSYVYPIWLSRNFGQHPATLAGMSSTGGDWIVTLDEDGQFDPGDIASMLDVALDEGAQLVYGAPTNPPPHGRARNASSRTAKVLVNKVLTENEVPQFSSFRLLLGEIGRGLAAYVGAGAYLDVALSWVVGSTAMCPVEFRQTPDRTSGYSWKKLFNHFFQLVITSGTRPLRLVSLMGAVLAAGGILVAVVLVILRILHTITVPGWTSVTVLLLLVGGANLVALGVVAEYVGAAVRMAMGKPLYLMTSDPAAGPLHRDSNGQSDLSANGSGAESAADFESAATAEPPADGESAATVEPAAEVAAEPAADDS